MKTIKQLTKDFSYVNSDITEDNFPQPKELRTDYKLYHFDRNISSGDAITEMKKDGYEPANLYELLEWKEWNDTDWVVSLGSSCEVVGGVSVPFLGSDDSGRCLGLGWRLDDWVARCRFLATKVDSKDSGALGTLDNLPLTLIINGIEYKKV